MHAGTRRNSEFNPDAPVYVPGGMSSYAASHGLGQKSHIPTAKVPNYVKRLGHGSRDTKPGLLPTPSVPPMRANISATMGYGMSGGANSTFRRHSSAGYDDSLATPYMPFPLTPLESSRRVSSSSSPFPSDSVPPGFEDSKLCEIDSSNILVSPSAASWFDNGSFTSTFTPDAASSPDILCSLINLLSTNHLSVAPQNNHLADKNIITSPRNFRSSSAAGTVGEVSLDFSDYNDNNSSFAGFYLPAGMSGDD